MTKLDTTQGPLGRDEVGLILPHEHVFVDLGTPESEAWKQTDPEDVIEVMAPELERARRADVTALVECTPVGVGRRVDIDLAVSEATGVPIVVPTGIYQDPRIPEWAREASEADLVEWMLEELTDEVEDTGVRAAWIKLSASDDGIKDVERKILRAAAQASAETGAAIGSHTTGGGDIVHEQLDVIESMGGDPGRFIWIHAQSEEDETVHHDVAERGAYVEYDGIGGSRDDYYVERVESMLADGYTDQLLLSQDNGWYDPSEPGGGDQRPYTDLVEDFLPKLREAQIPEETIRKLTHDNPFDAFAG